MADKRGKGGAVLADAAPAMEPHIPTELVKISDVARATKTSVATVDRQVRDGVIPVVRIGKLIRFDLREVMTALKAGAAVKKTDE